MSEFIASVLRERRSLETVLANLVAKHKRKPSPELARMIQVIEAEIIQRQPLVRGDCLPTLNSLG